MDSISSDVAKEHANNPQAGDIWHDMFSPVCVVLEVSRHTILISKKTKAAGTGYTYDLDYLERMSPQEFHDWLQYKPDRMKGKYWANCNPGAGMGFVLQLGDTDG